MNLHQWILVVTSRDQPKAVEFCKMYVQCASVMGISVSQPAIAPIQNDRTETYLQAIRSRLGPQVRTLMLAYDDDCNNLVDELLQSKPFKAHFIKTVHCGCYNLFRVPTELRRLMSQVFCSYQDSRTRRALSRVHVHLVECMYLRQRCSDAAVNKTILKPHLAAATGRQTIYVGFSQRNKIPRSSAYTISEKAIWFRRPDYNPDRAEKLISLSMS